MGECLAWAEGTQELRPASKRRSRVRSVSYAVLVAHNPDGELLLVQRPPDGLLGGLWEFPAVEIGVEDRAPEGPNRMGGELGVGTPLHERCRARLEGLGVQFYRGTVSFRVLPEVRHAFTHLKAVYRPMLVVGARSGEMEEILSDRIEPREVPERSIGPDPSEELAPEPHQWVTPDQVEHLPLPVAQRKILERARRALESF